MSDYEDEQLVNKFIGGDENSLNILISKYENLIYSVVLKIIPHKQDAEDVVADVFVKLLKNIHIFDSKITCFRNWICVISTNSALDFFKKKLPECFSGFEGEDGDNPVIDAIAADLPPVEDMVDRKIYMKKVMAEVAQLSPIYQEIITLYYYKGLNFREISEILEIPINTITSSHRRAMEKLKKKFKF